MILEVAILNVKPVQMDAFEAAFFKAQKIISSMPGYISHELQSCIEEPGQYLLLVNWESLEAHNTGFRESPQYEEWKSLLHHFYNPFPTVQHYQSVDGCGTT